MVKIPSLKAIDRRGFLAYEWISEALDRSNFVASHQTCQLDQTRSLQTPDKLNFQFGHSNIGKCKVFVL